MKADILNAVARVIDSGQYTLGREVSHFEEEAGQYLGVPYAVAVGNGTDALVLALQALGIGEGDEVVTTPFTFFATAEAISRVGAKPVFADIDAETYNIDLADAEAKITPRTKAIIPVHLFGQACEMKQCLELARRHKLYVIEDACQAFGAETEGAKLGTLGDIGCFSFFPTKNLSTIGDGGMVVTNNERLASRIRLLRNHGSPKKYYHDEIGFNSRLDEIHAAILRIGLQHIDRWNESRRLKAQVYDQMHGLSGVRCPVNRGQGNSHIYHLYCVEHDERDRLMDHLRDNGIASGYYYPLPLHLQAAYRHLGGKQGDCPVAERKSELLLALPLHPCLKEEEQKHVIRAVSMFNAKG